MLPISTKGVIRFSIADAIVEHLTTVEKQAALAVEEAKVKLDAKPKDKDLQATLATAEKILADITVDLAKAVEEAAAAKDAKAPVYLLRALDYPTKMAFERDIIAERAQFVSDAEHLTALKEAVAEGYLDLSDKVLRAMADEIDAGRHVPEWPDDLRDKWANAWAKHAEAPSMAKIIARAVYGAGMRTYLAVRYCLVGIEGGDVKFRKDAGLAAPEVIEAIQKKGDLGAIGSRAIGLIYLPQDVAGN